MNNDDDNDIRGSCDIQYETLIKTDTTITAFIATVTIATATTINN